jgi:hypothetical protein
LLLIVKLAGEIMADPTVLGLVLLIVTLVFIFGRIFLRWADRHTVPAVYTPEREAEERAEALRVLNAAHSAYEVSLRALKEKPSDPNLRQEALRLGRAYSSLTRQNGRVTVYDEISLANDINAACAATTNRSSDPPEARLARVTELRGRGLLSEEEFRLKRQEILDQL